MTKFEPDKIDSLSADELREALIEREKRIQEFQDLQEKTWKQVSTILSSIPLGLAILDEEGNQVPVNLYCIELNFDEGDCEAIDEGCTPGLIEDCNGICAPANWLGDGFCDDGSYEYNGNPIFFNCEEFDNDNGDCDVLGRTTEQRIFNRIPIGQ